MSAASFTRPAAAAPGLARAAAPRPSSPSSSRSSSPRRPPLSSPPPSQARSSPRSTSRTPPPRRSPAPFLAAAASTPPPLLPADAAPVAQRLLLEFAGTDEAPPKAKGKGEDAAGEENGGIGEVVQRFDGKEIEALERKKVAFRLILQVLGGEAGLEPDKVAKVRNAATWQVRSLTDFLKADMTGCSPGALFEAVMKLSCEIIEFGWTKDRALVDTFIMRLAAYVRERNDYEEAQGCIILEQLEELMVR